MDYFHSVQGFFHYSFVEFGYGDLVSLDYPAYQFVLLEYVVARQAPFVFIGTYDSDIVSLRLKVVYQIVCCEGGAVVRFAENLAYDSNFHRVRF